MTMDTHFYSRAIPLEGYPTPPTDLDMILAELAALRADLADLSAKIPDLHEMVELQTAWLKRNLPAHWEDQND